jgi:hypothetical protein
LPCLKIAFEIFIERNVIERKEEFPFTDHLGRIKSYRLLICSNLLVFSELRDDVGLLYLVLSCRRTRLETSQSAEGREEGRKLFSFFRVSCEKQAVFGASYSTSHHGRSFSLFSDVFIMAREGGGAGIHRHSKKDYNTRIISLYSRRFYFRPRLAGWNFYRVNQIKVSFGRNPRSRLGAEMLYDWLRQIQFVPFE